MSSPSSAGADQFQVPRASFLVIVPKGRPPTVAVRVTVLLPCGSLKAPVFESAANFNFGDQAQRAKLAPLMGSIQAAGAPEKDAAAFVAWLDSIA